ncbi:hypothetical protein [Corynebacterium amycolatum]|nr:hypothetical protein [Corynebacterium amycolatum]MDC7117496.1 hypothetical protein [Corynebacterium amycolatum]
MGFAVFAAASVLAAPLVKESIISCQLTPLPSTNQPKSGEKS